MYYFFLNTYIVSDGEKGKNVRSPSPKGPGAQSVDHTFIKDDII